MPGDLLAAARIDGCGEFRAFCRIALPLAAPVVALVGFFSFVANWNNFFLPYVMLPGSDQYPMQVGPHPDARVDADVQPGRRGQRRRVSCPNSRWRR